MVQSLEIKIQKDQVQENKFDIGKTESTLKLRETNLQLH